MRWRKKKDTTNELTVENNVQLEETAAESVVEDVAEEVSEEVSEETGEEASEEVSEETGEEASEEVSEETGEEASEEVSEETDEEASEEVSEETDEEASEEVSEETDEEVSEEVTEETEQEVPEGTEGEIDEEKTEETTESPKKNIWKTVGLVSSITVAVLLVLYAVGVLIYQDRFYVRTSINTVDFSGQTLGDVEAYMQEQVDEYVLIITGDNDITDEIKGTDIDVEYEGAEYIAKQLKKQNPFLWPVSLVKKSPINASIDFSYDEEKLMAKIAELECLKAENQVAPVSATPVYQEGTYIIQEEVYGTLVDQEAFKKAIENCIANIETELNLAEADCYVQPTFKKDSTEVIAAQEAMNKCISSNITYSLDGITVEVDDTLISQWLSVDDSMNMVISTDAVRAFADTLGTTYNTAPRAQYITTPTGKQARVSGATVGRVIGCAAEAEQLIEEIQEGTTIVREPIIAQHATPEGQYTWGNTYAEVDISAQTVWFISDGAVAFECPVITGVPGMDTPAGVFKILEKLRNKTLVGNIVPETGQPEYRTPVDYWARVTWSGVGFHDASWQSVFGGTIYRTAGSHGCINMPPEQIPAFYDMVYVGCPVIIHY